MEIKSNALAINSLLILIATAFINTIVHEFAHYLTALYFNMEPVLHHNYVETFKEGTPRHQMLESAAGPLFSLIFGTVILLISIKLIKPSLLKLFLLWLGMGGILVFMGYILIAPIAKEGDTGKVFDYFGFPIYLSVILAILSFLVIYKIFTRLAPQFQYYKNTKIFDEGTNAKQLFLYPILGSVIIGTLLNLPVVIWVSLLPTIFMPMAYFSIMGAYKNLKIADAPVQVDKISISLVIITLLTVIAFRFLV